VPFSDERSKMREAVAVQAFEEGLKVVNIIDHRSEYAMLQNNLGNALQYASSSHVAQNNLRALDAYDEALKVRTREAAPLQYANTIANRANCLWNLPDDPEHPEDGNRANLALVVALIAGAVASVIGGALGGVAIGGKSLGNELAALMGGFFGPLAAIPGLVIGLVILRFIG
jgi:hypothetical protein